MGFFGEEAVKEVGWAGGRGLRGVGIFLKREIRKWTIEENWLRVLSSNLAEMKKFSFPVLDFSAKFFFLQIMFHGGFLTLIVLHKTTF